MQQDEQEARESTRQPLSELYKKAEPDREQREPPQPLPGGIPVTPQPVTETEVLITEEQVEQEKPPEKPSRLEKLERQKSQIEAKIKAIHARENEKTRRERTRRLIQIGALSEKYFNCEGIEPGQYEELLKKLVAEEKVKTILKRG